jgi:hypothetical protein
VLHSILASRVLLNLRAADRREVEYSSRGSSDNFKDSEVRFSTTPGQEGVPFEVEGRPSGSTCHCERIPNGLCGGCIAEL